MEFGTKTTFHILLLAVLVGYVTAQAYVGGAYDFGQNRYGERRGDLGPAAIAGITIGALSVLAALAVTVFFCFYVSANSEDPDEMDYPATKYHQAGSRQ